jgi:hypothetical protein
VSLVGRRCVRSEIALSTFVEATGACNRTIGLYFITFVFQSSESLNAESQSNGDWNIMRLCIVELSKKHSGVEVGRGVVVKPSKTRLLYWNSIPQKRHTRAYQKALKFSYTRQCRTIYVEFVFRCRYSDFIFVNRENFTALQQIVLTSRKMALIQCGMITTSLRTVTVTRQ